MCLGSSPKITPAPTPPAPVTPVQEDQAAQQANLLERRRAMARYGAASTIAAGNVAPASATGGGGKTLLGQ